MSLRVEGEKPTFHIFERELSRRLKRNKDSNRLSGILSAVNEYAQSLDRLSEAETKRHDQRTVDYTHFIRSIFSPQNQPARAAEVSINYGQTASVVVRREGDAYFEKYIINFELFKPEHVSTQEEFLHAYECYARREHWFLRRWGVNDGEDFALGEMISGMTHCLCFVDQALTLGADRAGKLEWLRSHAQQVTAEDANRLRPYKFSCNEILGKSLNERFQYSPVNLNLFGEYAKTLDEDLDVYLNGVGGKDYRYLRTEMLEAFQLFSVAYGLDFLPLLFELLDSESPEVVVEKAAKWIEKCLQEGGETVRNLVRHYVPLPDTTVTEENLFFSVGERLRGLIKPVCYGPNMMHEPPLKEVAVPRIIDLTDFSYESILRKKERNGERIIGR